MAEEKDLTIIGYFLKFKAENKALKEKLESYKLVGTAACQLIREIMKSRDELLKCIKFWDFENDNSGNVDCMSCAYIRKTIEKAEAQKEKETK